jgi:Mrp family chromosome partitioning ATPase/DUF971 family protein
LPLFLFDHTENIIGDFVIQEADILKALGQIIDPDFNKDIVSLGFVKNIKICGGEVAFEIELTTPACPVKAMFEAEAKRVVGELDGVENVNIIMTAQENSRTLGIPDSQLVDVKSIIAISSCKGGVGKSTVSASIAKELSQRGFKVGLLDADIFGPSIPTLFNLQAQHLYASPKGNNMLLPVTVDGIKVVSFGFLAGDQPAVMRGPMVSNYINQLLHKVEWGDLDYLFIDFPPGTGDIQLTITQTVQLDGAVIVTTPQALSLVDVGKGILMFDKVNVPVLGVIENMSYFICDGCDKEHYIFAQGGAKKLEEKFGLPTLAQLPLSPKDFSITFDQKIENKAVSEAVNKLMMAIGKSCLTQGSKPTATFDEKSITLKWVNGEIVTIDNLKLRANCRCAHCVNEMTGEQILKKESIKKDIQAEQVNIVGNYALQVAWDDDHDTGLYSYSLIRELAKG